MVKGGRREVVPGFVPVKGFRCFCSSRPPLTRVAHPNILHNIFPFM